jgi:hypothetical protein
LLYNNINSIDVPVGFYQVPDPKRISTNPQEVKEHYAVGNIHSHILEKIVNYVIFSKKSNLYDEYPNLLEEHQIESDLLSLEKDELADFVRHLVRINRHKISWDVADIIIYHLDKLYTPRWKLDVLEYDSALRNLIKRMIEYPFSDVNIKAIKLLLENETYLTNYELSVVNKLLSTNVYSMKLFLELYDILLNFQIQCEMSSEIAEKPEVLETLKDIEQYIFLNIVQSSTSSEIYEKFALASIFLPNYVKSKNYSVEKGNDIVNFIKERIEVDRSSNEALKLSINSLYAITLPSIFEAQNDFSAKSRLIGQVKQHFDISILEISKIEHVITKSRVYPYTFLLIREGYLSYIKIYSSYYDSLPDSKLKENALNEIKNLLNFNIDQIVRYFSKYYDINLPEAIVDENLTGIFVDKISNPIIIRLFVNNLTEILKLRLLVNNKDEDLKHETLIVNYPKLIKNFLYSNSSYLHEFLVGYKLGTYKFQEIFQEILKELDAHGSLIISNTFEKEILAFISQNLEGFLYNPSERLLSEYERLFICLLFTTEWLRTFSLNYEAYEEGLILLCPIISMTFMQIARAFYEIGRLQMAFVAHLNFHYFLEWFNAEMKNLSLAGTDKGLSTSNLFSKFIELIEGWNEKISINVDWKRLATTIELEMKDFGTVSSNELGGMLDDEIVFGFMDMMQEFELFLSQELEEYENDPQVILEKIGKAKSLQPPIRNSTNVMDLIGSDFVAVENKFPFPIIRNFQQFTTALQIFPIDDLLVKMQEKISVSFKKFMSYQS